MSGWYWRDGSLALPYGMDFNDPLWLTQIKAIEEKLCDMSYRVVKQEVLDTGYFLSTVWLGLDHRFLGDGPPIIFETMCFLEHGDYRESCDCERYSTEEEARLGHEVMKLKWSYAGLGSPVDKNQE